MQQVPLEQVDAEVAADVELRLRLDALDDEDGPRVHLADEVDDLGQPLPRRVQVDLDVVGVHDGRDPGDLTVEVVDGDRETLAPQVAEADHEPPVDVDVLREFEHDVPGGNGSCT